LRVASRCPFYRSRAPSLRRRIPVGNAIKVETMGTARQSAFVLAGGEQIDQTENIEKTLVFLLLYSDSIPREWGERGRKVLEPALHHKRIQIGLGLLDNDGQEANQHYFAMLNDPVLFDKPSSAACFELTAKGQQIAERLLAEVQAGQKPWGLKDLYPELAASASPARLTAQRPGSRH
jgi:hypothetical protein